MKLEEAIDALREAMGDRHWALVYNPVHPDAQGFRVDCVPGLSQPPYVTQGLLHRALLGIDAVESKRALDEATGEDDEDPEPEGS